MVSQFCGDRPLNDRKNHTQIKTFELYRRCRDRLFREYWPGSITANYDGKKKHKTIIKDKAQIGSGTILVAPVVIGRSAKTGAGRS